MQLPSEDGFGKEKSVDNVVSTKCWKPLYQLSFLPLEGFLERVRMLYTSFLCICPAKCGKLFLSVVQVAASSV